MPEHEQHERATAEVHLGALLVQTTDTADAQAAIDAALRMHHHPGDETLVHLTDRLLTHCASLGAALAEIAEAERPARGTAAMEYWAGLRDSGPTDGPLANWSYCRQLALVARDMLQALDDYRTGARRRADGAFVGRESMPPLAPGQPR